MINKYGYGLAEEGHGNAVYDEVSTGKLYWHSAYENKSSITILLAKFF